MSGIEDYEAIAQRAKALKSGYAASFDYVTKGAPKPRVFKSGLGTNTLREEARKRGFGPKFGIKTEWLPRCPRHDGQYCTRPCAEQSDCPRGVVA